MDPAVESDVPPSRRDGDTLFARLIDSDSNVAQRQQHTKSEPLPVERPSSLGLQR
jgi:hypothetical protein